MGLIINSLYLLVGAIVAQGYHQPYSQGYSGGYRQPVASVPASPNRYPPPSNYNYPPPSHQKYPCSPQEPPVFMPLANCETGNEAVEMHCDSLCKQRCAYYSGKCSLVIGHQQKCCVCQVSPPPPTYSSTTSVSTTGISTTPEMSTTEGSTTAESTTVSTVTETTTTSEESTTSTSSAMPHKNINDLLKHKLGMLKPLGMNNTPTLAPLALPTLAPLPGIAPAALPTLAPLPAAAPFAFPTLPPFSLPTFAPLPVFWQPHSSPSPVKSNQTVSTAAPSAFGGLFDRIPSLSKFIPLNG